MTPRLALLCILVVAGVASAQTVVPRLAITRTDDPNFDSLTFASERCGEAIVLKWVNTLFFGCTPQDLRLWSTEGECGEKASGNDTVYDPIPGLLLTSQGQGNFTVKVDELPAFKMVNVADGGTASTVVCGGPDPTTKIHRVCGAVTVANNPSFGCSTLSVQSANSFKLIYDTEPPDAPVITEKSAQDEAVKVSFTVDTDTTVVILEVRGPTDLDFRQLNETVSSNGSIRGDGLENNVAYQVRIRAKDAAGNVSLPSIEETMTPIRTIGFWGKYKDLGGTDTGGCSVGVGLMPMLLIALALRRSRQQARKEVRRKSS